MSEDNAECDVDRAVTQLHSYTVTQLHSYTVTQLHSYTVTQLHSYTGLRKVLSASY